MRKFISTAMAKLSRELSGGLARLKMKYVNSAEELSRMIDPAQEYPFDFVLFWLTGYKGGSTEVGEHKMLGADLRKDLLELMLDVCDHAKLHTSDYDEQVYDTPLLAKRFKVSAKTIQRWRNNGLPARRLIFPDGKRRVAFCESSVEWFTKGRARQIDRSGRFTQMTDLEREQIIRWAKRMVAAEECCLSEVARRLAERTGRAVETIRYTIRRHDSQRPDEAIFPAKTGPMGEQDKKAIYRAFLKGIAVGTLARHYNRTRGSIYRVVNEMRAMELLDKSIGCIYNPQFDLPNADDVILGDSQDIEPLQAAAQKLPSAPGDLPPYLRSLYGVPLLTADEEKDLFRRYNYIKHKADKLRRQIDPAQIRTTQLKRIERLLMQANVVKNRIIRANLRLVVSIAKKHVGGAQTLFELISDGNVSLMRAVEKFDYARGNRFSTYASWAIMRNFARSVTKEQVQRDHFVTGQEEILDIARSMQSYDASAINIRELRESIDLVLAQLTATERSILIGHFGLDEKQSAKTLDELGRRLSLSKERVRQIEIRALKKLRDVLYPQRAELLS